MPRARRGPNGPRTSAGGAPGTNKRTKMPKGSTGSGSSHNKQLTPRTKGRYGGGKKKGY